jgi:hypothetical protein
MFLCQSRDTYKAKKYDTRVFQISPLKILIFFRPGRQTVVSECKNTDRQTDKNTKNE